MRANDKVHEIAGPRRTATTPPRRGRCLSALHRGRRAFEWAFVIIRRASDAVRLLPARIALFYIAALVRAVVTRDRFALVAATHADDLSQLLEAAAAAKNVVEVGTGPGWTAIALALARRDRTVLSFDIETRPAAAYARLVPKAVRERIQFVRAAGADGVVQASEVDFLFIDSSHEREETIETFESWRPKLTSDATVVFHDYGVPLYPGVEQAVSALGLEGDRRRRSFVWHSDTKRG